MEVTTRTVASRFHIIIPHRTLHRILFLLLVHFLVEFAQGNGPGDDRVNFETLEGLPPGTTVGVIPVRAGYTYQLDRTSDYFALDISSGVLKNKQILDRDSSKFFQDVINLFALGSKPSNPPHPVEILIKILDINDNNPVFQEQSMNITFSENAKGSQHIIVTATDIDLGPNGTVSQYDIISGNHEGNFKLVIPSSNSPFMYIETLESLNRETKDHYLLNISARDNGIPPLYGFLLVNISVSDINDNPPSFTAGEYTTKILENANIGTSVIQVLATDADIGLNKEIIYSLLDDTGQFSIEEDTGIVRSQTKPLKCSRVCGKSLTCSPYSCLLTVLAEDKGSPSLSDRAYITISIVDTNDHSPVITFDHVPDPSKDYSSVDENTELGKRVASISVQDADTGINSETVVRITRGNELEHFKLMSIFSLNIIRVAGHLDREKLGIYNLTIVATDKGIPPRSSTAFLIIKINDANDHAPVFKQSQYSVSLPETSLPGSFVASVQATDQDSGLNSDLVYSIEDGNALNWFGIDSATGLITIKNPLDHEKQAKVHLNISAQDGGSQPFVSHASVVVTILDENDEIPTFNQSVYNLNMDENLNAGREVLAVQAEDGDNGINGSVSYSFHPDVDSLYPGTFRLNTDLGIITALKSFDRETISSYKILLIASDHGNPSLSSTASINLMVNDLNDNAPQFYPEIIFGNVQESRPSGTEVVQVAAVDPDEAENGKITYSFGSNDFNSFLIDSGTGSIRTTKQLSRSTAQSYELTIIATDGGGRVSDKNAIVKVSVTNVDDIAPVFAQQFYSFRIPEDGDSDVAQIGRRVGQVSATSRNAAGGVTYAIAGGDPLGTFEIGTRTGEITTSKKVDREVQNLYSLKVITMAGSKFRDVTVNITVSDVNDNSPKFRSSAVTTNVIENWPIGHNIFLAEAVDPDEGENGRVTYRLQSNSDMVDIDESTGVIYLKKVISNLTPSKINLKIIATDAGSSQKSSAMDLHVNIVDVNDHTPVFQRNRYEVSIPESKPINEHIFKLFATDGDSGRNSEMYFKIVRGNEGNTFGIFPDGSMYVAHGLDREKQDLYMVTVVVCDRGEISRSSTANITINILDDNDNPPVFMNSTFDLYIHENQPANTFIGQVKAKDADAGRNSELSYWLDGQKNFTIDVPSGRIFTSKSFDREQVIRTTSGDYYSFYVYVRDDGVPQKQARALVKAHILDENDNAPVFSRKRFTASIKENAQMHTNITIIGAQDLDNGINAFIRYTIAGGNEEGKFKIDDRSGQVALINRLDREQKDMYHLVIVAKDSGKKIQHSSSTTLDITVTDFNDERPIFLNALQQVQVSESSNLGHLVASFSATDKDIGNNAVLFYNIVAGNDENVFNIDAHNGRLYLTRMLDFESKAQYDLDIRVSDAGSPSLSSTMRFVVNVEDENDNSPVFQDTSSSVSISEGKKVGSSLTIVRATDKDSGIGGEVFYSIAKQEPVGSNFRIDENTGQIFIKKEIDREENDMLKITVLAMDKAMPETTRKWSEKVISVIVQDINDHAPAFESMNAVILLAGSARGDKVTTVLATDPDSGDNGQVSYDLVGGDTSLFSLQSTSGELLLSQELPSSAISYKITVRAKDNGGRDVLGQKSTRMDITIIISNPNNNGPVFSNILSGTVYENEAPGKSILTLKATASQTGVTVEYYVTNITSNDISQARLYTVDKLNGVLKTTQEMDREVLPELYQLEVTAMEVGGNSPRIRTVKVQVRLLDKNDSPPRFTSQFYSVSISADQEVGKSFTRVSYDDADSVGAATVKLLDVDDSDLFSINKQTGAISTKQRLDRSRRSVYKLEVEATDGFQSSQTTVRITVQDHNPSFNQSFYSFDVPEDTAVGTTIASVVATDLDEGPEGHVTYELQSDWGKDKFRLDATLGTFMLIDRLDFEEIQLYTLKVVAKDGSIPPRSATVMVYMNVKDYNDNAPLFEKETYQAVIAENAVVGSSVTDVTAVDKDSGINAEVRYSLIGGDGLQQFGIGSINGTIFTTEHLDRETTHQYSLIIQATDEAEDKNQRLSSIGTVIITLLDVNDSPPEFVTPNVTYVMENSQRGSVVFTVIATDKDEGDNSKVDYSLTSAPVLGNPFTLNSNSGDLKVNQDLDRETLANYSLQILARDHGNPQLSAIQNLVILLGDDNDNPPIFSKTLYTKTVAENISIGTSLLKVLATDADEGLNGIVRYFIIAGDDNYDFNMDMSSGVLRVQKALDYERMTSYSLTVLAEDSSINKPMNSTTKVFINITDINDFEPIFVDSPYYAYVQENMNELPVHVIQVSAQDEDSGSNSRLIYAIRSEEEERKIFSMNSSTGEITANLKLDREKNKEYDLIVVAFDRGHPRLTGSGTVTVFVKDANDHAPVFESNGPYTGHVTENLPPKTEVLTVRCTDEDEGINAQIIYSLEDSADGKFTILPDSGRIITLERLDREVEDMYYLTVIASDQGIPPLTVTSQVIIYVDDDNDNEPQFEHRNYTQMILDATEAGEFVLGVTALDRDIGNNGKVTYRLEGQDASMFNINTNTGVITAAQRLSGNAITYIFSVRATDQGENTRSQIVSVAVRIQRVNNAVKPAFSPFPNNLQLPENTIVGFFLTTVIATSSRTGSVTYHIAGGNVGQGFAIDMKNGSVTVAGNLDYEIAETINLWIEARDGGTPSVSSYRQLPIGIQDVNDNTPRFKQSFYEEHISENVRKGTTLVRVEASDDDSASNGLVVFALTGGNKNNTFVIDSNRGIITTNNIVDRESIDLFHLVIEASDMGSPNKRTSTATVKVTVVDINDNRPKFTNQFQVSIPEDMTVNSIIIQITSTDKDIKENAVANYELLNTTNKFSIDRVSGNLTIRSKLDAEEKDTYSLIVQAVDESFSVKTYVSVRILDVNDNAPIIAQSTMRFDLHEQQPPNSPVGNLLASDRDISKPNNQFFYSLKRPSTFFDLDAETGTISALNTMTFIHGEDGPSSANHHLLDVVVTDFGTPAMSSEAQIIINIIDANNYAPVFKEKSYTSAVPENARIGDTIIRVVAKDDKDFGINAEIFYVLVGGNGTSYFDINRETGELSVASSVNGQRNRYFALFVEARDKGQPTQAVSTTVMLQVTDVNNDAPTFVNGVFDAALREDVTVGQRVGTVRATDNDQGLNGQVQYMIRDGDPEELFTIGKTSGVITTAKELDFEKSFVHSLNITARDMGLLYKETSRIFTVRIQDVNDNPPYFSENILSGKVAENSPRGTEILQVKATDIDTPPNAVIQYSITGNSQDRSMFDINANTGMISLQGSVDYESKTTYSIYVAAFNPGSSSSNLRSVAQVFIYVTSVNEFKPKFVQKQYSFNVSESAPVNTSLGYVLASDEDAGADKVVYYYLIGSSNMRGFGINSKTGIIFVNGRPDYESSPEIILDVLAKNRGSVVGDDTDQCQVRIDIEDANDPPVFSQNVYTGFVPENSAADTNIIKVNATDYDIQPENRQFTYTILGGNSGGWFWMDRVSGMIKTTGQGVLDRETTSVYNITVGAVDSGRPPQTGTAQVRIELQDVNDNGPIFDPFTLIVNFTETNIDGTRVVSLSQHTTDPDLAPNQGPYRYQALSSPSNSVFDIQQNGLVQTRSIIDRESVDHYVVPVQVTDNGQPRRTSTLSFTISVADVNDSPPEKRPLTILFNVLDKTPSSGKIADVRPLDDDLIGDYSCSIQSGSGFTIPSKCDLYASSNPQAKTHRITVSGSDGLNGQVTYDVTVQVAKFTNSTLGESVAIRLSRINVKDFLTNIYSKFMNSMRNLLGSDKSVLVFSIQSLDTDLLVYVAVMDNTGGHLSRENLDTFLKNNLNNIETSTSAVIKETSYSPCYDEMCKNGGTCKYNILMRDNYQIQDSDHLILTSLVPDFKTFCECPPSYTGDFCEIPMGPCGDTYCYNGGSCQTINGKEQCHCTIGWDGPSCQLDKDECKNNPCQNGGTCVNLEGSFECKCVSGFHGNLCESSYYCASMPCQNGGTCRNLDNGFICDCVFGYFGNKCDESSVGFAEGSFLEFTPIQDYSSVDMHVYFSTVQEKSLILFNPVIVDQTDVGFLAVEVIEGFVRFSIKLGALNPTRLQVNTKVSNGKWYRLDVQTSRDVAILKVVVCNEGATSCNQCVGQNPSCYDSKALNFGNHFVQGLLLSIGGVSKIENILSNGRDILSHDFIGCMHSFNVNGLDVLSTELASKHQGISASCPRRSFDSPCSTTDCGNGGSCIDEWASARCQCSDSYMGKTCEQEWEPFGFASDAKVTFKLQETYRRDQLLADSSGRKKRATKTSEVFIRLRTVQENGAIFYATTVDTKCVLWLEKGTLRFVLTPPKAVNDPLDMDAVLTDGKWHNITVTSIDNVFVLSVDEQRSEPKDFGAGFIFSSMDVKEMALSGERVVPPSGQRVIGFDGCISEFRVDKQKLPFDGKTDKYAITINGSVETGCKALCLNNPCGAGNVCDIRGEAFVCRQLAGGPGGLDTGIIVVIVFFVILIIAILIVFILFRRRRSMFPCKGNDAKTNKTNGALGRDTTDSTLRGMPIYATRNEELLQNQLTEELNYHKNSALSSRPDLIGSNYVGRPGSRPLMIDDGTVIIENGELEQIQLADDEMPEHYDLENASSIAPSDIDVVQHYKQYRSGEGPRYRQHPHMRPHNSHRPRESPLTVSGLSRESPNVHNFQNSAHLRQSPVSVSGSALSMPSRPNPHKLNNGANRPSSAQAVYIHGPHHRNSPITQLNIRQNPPGQHNSSRSSLGSHHSHSTNSSVPRNNLSKPLRNGKPKHVKGLTVEEINRLNARPGPPSPASLQEAMSSSSEGKRKLKMKPVENIHLDGSILLEPPDSSSSDSGANDSFTCSEFEYENDHRTRNDFDPETMIFSKLTEVDNETDDIPVQNRSNSDGMHSNCDSFTSTLMSSEEHFLPQKGPNGAFNIDSLLNWGPNFDKLVGVFKDIALLPDTETQPLEGGITTDHEEYV
ncbi:hypothetical protein SNE40_015917 [Patella caerulea]|uniref:Uncharacterized protein n=1 Tax=Patella caerulea TaxID=87958 RepID=A0AAN8J7T2_PATCE